MPRLPTHPATCQVELDGQPIPARESEPVAAAMLAAGETTFSRSIKYHRPRGPFCFSGACGQCLVRVDGVPNLAACQVAARPGMRIERQNAFPTAKLDLFSVTDWFFPKGLNHHEMFAGVPVAEQVMAKVARQLAGLGTLPDRPAPARAPARTLSADVVVVGGGISGLSAARELGAAGVKAVVLERDAALGGRWRLGTEAKPADFPAELGVAAWPGCQVVGVFEDQHGRFLVYVEHPTDDRAQLMVLRYQVLVLANGTHPSLLAFENNDLPNVFSAQAVARLVQVHGVLPGKHFAVVGQRAEADALASLLTRAGATVDAVGAEPVRAHGLTAVTALTVRREGREEKLDCDAVAVCVPGSPAFELARQAGAKVSWRDATQVFAVEAASDGRAADRLFVAGSLVGPCSGEQSARSGRVAGAAAAALLRSAP